MLKKAVLKRLLTAFLVFVCIMAVLGCGKRSAGEGAGNKEEEDVQESTELTQRQKELLEEMGLPADYGELTDTQKNAVTSVEALITYLEDKYHEKFCYLSYAEAGSLEEEHLEAYPASGTPSDIVTVYRTYEDGQYHYKDDYGNLEAQPLYEGRVKAFSAQTFPENGIKVFSDISGFAKDTDEQNVTEENVMQAVSAVTYIFISDNVCTEDQFHEFADQCAQWLGGQCQGRAAQICLRLTDTAQWQEIDENNYGDKLREYAFTSEAECAVSESGKVTVY